MLLARYAIFVGGALLALLLVVNFFVPAEPVPQTTNAESSDIPNIRIESERRWPDRVVYDTNAPTITPTPSADSEPSSPSPAQAVDAGADKTRGALAQLQPADADKPDPKQPPHARKATSKTARRHAPPPTRMVERQPQFGWFDMW